MPGERHPDAEEEGIAGGEHHDGRALERKHGLDRAFERAQPDMFFAGNQRCREFEMTRAAEDDGGGRDAALGLVAETR